MNTVVINQRENELAREISIKPGEDLTYIFLQNESDGIQKTNLHFKVSRGSKLKLWHLFFGGQIQFQETVHFDEENALVENYTVFFGDASENFDIKISHLHNVPSGTSRIWSRGILKDTAYGKFDGIIKIAKEARKTDAFLEEKTLLLSAGAKSEAIPALEIGTNEVKAAHSASCTRVDENQLFYAAARGIPEEEALRMIAEGFLRHLVIKLPDPKLQKEAFDIIRDKLTPTL